MDLSYTGNYCANKVLKECEKDHGLCYRVFVIIKCYSAKAGKSAIQRTKNYIYVTLTSDLSTTETEFHAIQKDFNDKNKGPFPGL